MRSRLSLCLLVALIAAGAASSAAPIRILLMHHSTGANLIQEGGVREGLSALGYEFSDHGYSEQGLYAVRGDPTGANFAVPDDNTDPDGWATVFAQPVVAPPTNTLSWMLGYDIVLFKSCFPSSNITDGEMLSNYKCHYLSVRATIDRSPDRLFIAFTPPPLVPNKTEPANAARAQEWAMYLTSSEFRGGRRNLAVFDFFSLLADENDVPRQEYRGDEWDSHPNRLANETIGPRRVDFVRQAIVGWQSEGG